MLLKSPSTYNLKNLILTIKGERVGQPEFGCVVHRIVFEPITETTGESIEEAVRDAEEAQTVIEREAEEAAKIARQEKLDSTKSKLEALGLTTEEVKEAFGL